MDMGKKKKTNLRNWSTPLDDSRESATKFAQNICTSLSILKLIKQVEELEKQGMDIDEAYKERLLLSLITQDAPVGEA